MAEKQTPSKPKKKRQNLRGLAPLVVGVWATSKMSLLGTLLFTEFFLSKYSEKYVACMW